MGGVIPHFPKIREDNMGTALISIVVFGVIVIMIYKDNIGATER